MATKEPESIPLVKHPLKGRELLVQIPDFGQFGLLQHQSRVLQKDNITDQEAVRAVSVSYRILLSCFPDVDDKNYVEDLIADREVDMIGLTRFVLDASKKIADEFEAPKPAVRRGRPRKAA
jgi:hypothetical protein